MIISDPDHAFVWIWLPNAVKPVVAGKLEAREYGHDFFYGKNYLANPEAIALDLIELPLVEHKRLKSIYHVHQVIRDSLPDAWGRRLLLYQHKIASLSTLQMLLMSSSDRFGALHFQVSVDHYVPKCENNASLEQLLEVTDRIERGKPIPKTLLIALLHGTSIGGARPKALINEGKQKFIAKFSSTTDLFPIVQAEFAAMWLAKKIGLNIPEIKLINQGNKFILLVERFDRELTQTGWLRKFAVSALTMLQLDETQGRYASYLDLADQIRQKCKTPIKDLRELFRRMVFNILIGNTDDHAKNHAFFWDGTYFSLTPAYDICPYLRVGQQATQAMTVGKQGAYSQLANAASGAKWFDLTPTEAKDAIAELVENVKRYWPLACQAAKLTKHQQQQLTGTAVLNPYCFYAEP